MRLTYLTKYSKLGPSSRYRVYQFEERFRASGVQLQVQPLFDDRYFQILRGAHPSLSKPAYVLSRFEERRRFLKNAAADLFVIEQQLFPYLPMLLEKRLLPKKFFVEFDDAIYLTHPHKLPRLFRAATGIIAGNQVLLKYAQQWNQNAHMIPTVLDTDVFKPSAKPDTNKVRIGWTGLEYNFKYLEYLSPVFRKLIAQYPIEIVIVSGSRPANLDFPLRFERWNSETEVSQINEFDIGVMPLVDDEWSRGKCGMKLLQFMALQMPAVATPVGVNAEIIRDGENGFSAASLEQWNERLTLLVSDTALRERVGRAARDTVVQNYSVDVWFPRLLSLLRSHAGA